MRHMRTHVEEQRRFSCSVCGKRFMQLPTLTRHMMVHTGGGGDPTAALCVIKDSVDVMSSENTSVLG